MSEMSEMESSWVASPHSESWVAMERRSLAADSWWEVREEEDLRRRVRRLERSGWVKVGERREGKEKGFRWCWDGVEVVVPVEERFWERIERARFLEELSVLAIVGLVLWWAAWVPLGKGVEAVCFVAFAGHDFRR